MSKISDMERHMRLYLLLVSCGSTCWRFLACVRHVCQVCVESVMKNFCGADKSLIAEIINLFNPVSVGFYLQME